MRYLSDVVGALHNKPMQPSGELHPPLYNPRHTPQAAPQSTPSGGASKSPPLVYRER
jgi:hypothetical protein